MFDIQVGTDFFGETMADVRHALGVPQRGRFELALTARYTMWAKECPRVVAFATALGEVLSNRAYRTQIELLEQGLRATGIIIPMDTVYEVSRAHKAIGIKRERARWLACFWMCWHMAAIPGQNEYLTTEAIEMLHRQVSEMFEIKAAKA